MSDSLQIERSLEADSDGLVVADEEGVVSYASAEAATLLDTERERLLGSALSAHDGELWEHCREVLETGTRGSFELLVDGRRAEGTAHPVGDGVSVVVRDVSERERLESARETAARSLERLHTVATDPTLTTEGKIERMLEVGIERLDTESGLLARIDGDRHEVEVAAGAADRLVGTETPLSETYCRHTLDEDGPVAFTEAGEQRPEDPAYETKGYECYLGASLRVAGDTYGTVCFFDADRRPESFTERELTFAELLTNWIHYLLEQDSYEQELRAQQAFTESLIDSLPDPLYAFDENGELTRFNDRMVDVTGYSESELEGKDPTELVAAGDTDRMTAAIDRVRSGERISLEAALETADGEQLPYEFSGAPLRDGTDEVVGAVGVGRDVSERTEHQRRLSGLLETTQSFMQAKDPDEVAEIAVNAARDLLGFETSIFRLYDPERELLEPAAQTDRALEVLGERPAYDVDAGRPGEVFASGEPMTVDELPEAELGPIRSAMYYPAGVRGTLSVCSTDPDAFDESDERLLGLLATVAAAACTRAKRERDVREARQHTDQVLDRINGLVRQTVEVLVEATAREELETGVVEQLAAAEPYTFAWIGRPGVTGESLEPSTWAGPADLDPEAWSFDIETDPIGAVYREGSPEVFDGETVAQSWPAIAGTVGGVIAVPLVYKDTSYGVLVVYAQEPGALDERERVVLEALGRASANAINAVERGRILDATEIIELEFSVGDSDLLFNRLSAGGGTVESAGSEFRADGRVELYLAASDVDPDEFLERVRDDPEVEETTCIVAQEDECLLEVVVSESLLTMLTEYGAAPKSVVATEGRTRVTVELPYEAEARELFGLVESEHPSTDLLGYHERERPVETRQDFTAALAERLTDRQETALRTAYLGGFFDWPRGVDGNELAEAMDISRPTFHQHLRAAEHKVFEELFD